MHATGHSVFAVGHSCPSGQLAHSIAPSPEYVAAGHACGVFHPIAGHIVPFGQFKQLGAPPGPYSPASHAFALVPSGHSYPMAHGGGSIVFED